MYIHTCVALFFSILATTSVAARKPFSTTNSLEAAFGGGKFSYDVNENWALCMGRNETIMLDEGIDDYGRKFNDTLKQLSREGGGAIMLSAGVYPITVPVLLQENTCMIGVGKDKTVIRVKNESYPKYEFRGALYARKVERVTLVGLTIDGNVHNQQFLNDFHSRGRAGVYQERVHHSYMLNVKSINNFRHGFDLHGSDGHQAYHIAIDGCESIDNGGDGLRLDQCHYVGVANSALKYNGRHAFAASTSAERFKITNTQFVGSGQRFNYGCGVYMDGKRNKRAIIRDIKFSNCAFRDNVRSAVCMRYAENVDVTHSSIMNLEDASASCYYVRNVKALNTTATECGVLSGVTFEPAEIDVYRKAEPEPSGASRGCPNAIAYFDICCPMECGTCGKPGCSRRGGDKGKNDACCYSETKMNEDDCNSKKSAPCVLRNVGAMEIEMP